MLDAFIIDELRRREEEEGRRSEQPVLDLPSDGPDNPKSDQGEHDDEETPKRGVVVIDL